MRLLILPMIILLLFNGVIDFYIYRLIKSKTWKRVHLIASVLLAVYLIVSISIPRRNGSDQQLQSVMWLLFIYLSIYIPKILCVIVALFGEIPRLWHRHRWKVMTAAGVIVAVVTFVAMWWGALINRHNIDVIEQTFEFENLPPSFDGYKIALFSDFHVGSYGNDTTFVADAVDKINSLNTDAIMFLGDIVNRQTDELIPFVSPLSRLKAPDGVMAVLGNHDYGDYRDWPSAEARKANNEALYRLFDKMGWDLICNQTRYLTRGTDSIAVIGVENCGDPPFSVYGSLRKSYDKSFNTDAFKILLTHNPSHWAHEVCYHDTIKIDLTFSGHTHAMQISTTIGGKRYSPAAFRYPNWGGRYDDGNGRILYVNIGIGTVGLPMRIGATPEITLVTLRRKKQ
ncbi:MAG: metallophosphoesterase [Muribaculaceae bacterium]|nr:metallophosphoesterase [Muribaculaceae bacterium]